MGLFKRRANKSELTFRQARLEVQQLHDYFQSRLDLGDPLLDQWMADTFEASRVILEQLDILQENGMKTGLRTTERNRFYLGKDNEQ